MSRKYELLHSDFESYEMEVRRRTPYIFAIVTVAIIGAFVLLSSTLEMHNVSHMPAIIAIVGLALVLPFLCRDLFFDDLKWHRYATSVVNSVKPHDVVINYGYTFMVQSDPTSSHISKSCLCVVISDQDGDDDAQKVYGIKFYTDNAKDYLSTFPKIDNKQGIEKAKKNSISAKAFIDPVSKEAVMIEFGGTRLWVDRVV